MACSPQVQSGNGAIGDSPPAATSQAREATDTNTYTSNTDTSVSEPAGGDRGIKTPRDSAGASPGSGRATTQTQVFMARAKTPLVVLGRFMPGRLDVAGGCLTVTLAGAARAATAVFPPDARLVYRDGKPAAVTFGARTIAIGEDTRIPGGGSASPANLATALPAGCPGELYPIGG